MLLLLLVRRILLLRVRLLIRIRILRVRRILPRLRLLSRIILIILIILLSLLRILRIPRLLLRLIRLVPRCILILPLLLPGAPFGFMAVFLFRIRVCASVFVQPPALASGRIQKIRFYGRLGNS